jgi:hypothetical protein
MHAGCSSSSKELHAYALRPGHGDAPLEYAVPSDASRPARRIDLGAAPCSGTWRPSFSADGRRVFWLDEDACGLLELWSLRLPQRVRASDGRP